MVFHSVGREKPHNVADKCIKLSDTISRHCSDLAVTNWRESIPRRNLCCNENAYHYLFLAPSRVYLGTVRSPVDWRVVEPAVEDD